MPVNDIESAYQNRRTFAPPSKWQVKTGSVAQFEPAIYTFGARLVCRMNGETLLAAEITVVSIELGGCYPVHQIRLEIRCEIYVGLGVGPVLALAITSFIFMVL